MFKGGAIFKICGFFFEAFKYGSAYCDLKYYQKFLHALINNKYLSELSNNLHEIGSSGIDLIHQIILFHGGSLKNMILF